MVTELETPGESIATAEPLRPLREPAESAEPAVEPFPLLGSDDGEFPSGGRCLRRVARKAAVTALGSSVLVLGTALIPLPLPGAAILVIPIGLAILATEFAWAQKLVEPLRKLLQRLKAVAARLLRRPPTRR
jgi:hypothetical protein